MGLCSDASAPAVELPAKYLGSADEIGGEFNTDRAIHGLSNGHFHIPEVIRRVAYSHFHEAFCL